MEGITQADRQRHLAVLDEAHNIYIDRSEERGQMWKKMGADDALHHIGSKSKRVTVLDGLGQFAEDDALDLINYAVFYIRLKRAERLKEDV